MKDKLNKSFTFKDHHKPFVVSQLPKVKELLGEEEKKNNIDEKKLFQTKNEKRQPLKKKKP